LTRDRKSANSDILVDVSSARSANLRRAGHGLGNGNPLPAATRPVHRCGGVSGIFGRPLTIRRAGRYNFGYYPNGISSSSDYHRAQKSLCENPCSAFSRCGPPLARGEAVGSTGSSQTRHSRERGNPRVFTKTPEAPWRAPHIATAGLPEARELEKQTPWS
jgi:hypothetical protein